MTAYAYAGATALPLRRPDRDTVQGFREWAAQRGTLERPSLLPRGEYENLPPGDRRRYDLRRRVINTNIDILDTPMSAAVSKVIEDTVMNNALDMSPGAKPGLMVNGGGAQGKTATVCEVLANFLEDWEQIHGLTRADASGNRRDAHEPVVYVRAPIKPTPKSLCTTILDALGEPYLKSDTFPDLQRRVHRVLVDLGVRVLVIDDITRIKMHRFDDQDVLDLIRALMDSGATLILIGVGVPKSGLLGEGFDVVVDEGDKEVHVPPGTTRLRRRANEDDAQTTQTQRRFKLLHQRNFRYGTKHERDEWLRMLVGLSSQLRLYGNDEHALLADGLPEYLFSRTGGVVGTLVHLVQDAATAAMAAPDPVTGNEVMTKELFEEITVDFAGEDGRVAEAGEVPIVPEHKPSRRGRPRSTVFDERAVEAPGA